MSQTQQTPDVNNIVGKLVMLNLEIGTFHGTSRTPFDGVSFQEELYTPGSLRLLDPKKLRWAACHKGQAHAACMKIGTRFLGGYAIPELKFKELQEELKEASDLYMAGREKFLGELTQAVDDWANSHPEHKSDILAKRPDHAYVSRQLRFRVAAFRVSPEELAVGLNDGIENEVGSMVWSIACEIAQDVKASWNPIAGRVTQRARGLLKRIAAKTDGLSFVSYKIARIRDLINQVDASLPANGHIEGKEFMMMQGLISLLGDPRQLLSDNHLEVVIEKEPAPQQFDAVASVAPTLGVEADDGVEVEAAAEVMSVPDVSSRPAQTYAW